MKGVTGFMAGSDGFLAYTALDTGGPMSSVTNGSRTGYFIQKLIPHTANKYDGKYNWSGALHAYRPYMRLADICLMYAESCAALGGANETSKVYNLSAVGAINKLRERVGAGEVGSNYIVDKNKFIDEVRRERAVELSFEGFRFNDLQRWLLLTEYPYNVKTSHEFSRMESDEFFSTEGNDPRNARIANLREEVLRKRVFGTKHYWFPLPDKIGRAHV